MRPLFELNFHLIELHWSRTTFNFACRCMLVRFELAWPEPHLRMVLTCGAHAPMFPGVRYWKKKLLKEVAA